MEFSHSPRAQDYIARLTAFLAEEVTPHEDEYLRQLTRGARPWNVPPIVETMKAKARAAGLWNLFLPDPQHGAGLSTVDYAPLAELMGRSAGRCC